MIALSWTFYLLSLSQLFQLSETKQKPPDSPQFSILDVTIGQDTLVTLQKKLGTGKKCRGSEHEGVEIVGYTDSKENLVFDSAKLVVVTSPDSILVCPVSRLIVRSLGYPHKLLDWSQREGFAWE